MQLKTRDIGHSCIVQYDDPGKVEGIIVEIDFQGRDAKVFAPSDNNLDSSVEFSQILSVGKRVLLPQ